LGKTDAERPTITDQETFEITGCTMYEKQDNKQAQNGICQNESA
jgi:hypothetical protein